MSVTQVTEQTVCFSITGEFLTWFPRQRVLERSWRHGLRVLTESLQGITIDQAVSVLNGSQMLVGDSNVGMNLTTDSREDTAEYLELLNWQYRFVYRLPGDKHWQPYAIVDNWGPEDLSELRDVSLLKRFSGAFEGKSSRSLHYRDDLLHDDVTLVGPPDFPTHYLVKQVDPPFWMSFPTSLAQVVDRDGVAEGSLKFLDLPRRGRVQCYGLELVGPPPEKEKPVPELQPEPKQKTIEERMVPDWGSASSSRGGGKKLDDIKPQPHVRMYPHSGCPRRVQVVLSTFRGTCPGARHWYARLKEEHNPVWDGEEGRWFTATDDVVGKGRQFPPNEMNQLFVDQKDRSAYDQAKQWVAKMLAKHFAGPEYQIETEDYGNGNVESVSRLPWDGD